MHGAQRVEGHGALERGGAAADQGGGEAAGAVVERDVVGVRGDAAAVKGDEHVNVGRGLLVGALLGEGGRKGGHEQA